MTIATWTTAARGPHSPNRPVLSKATKQAALIVDAATPRLKYSVVNSVRFAAFF